MPIKVTCQCGKSFAAKDELAGKAVKCPNCQQPLRIPGGSAAPAKPAAAKPAAKPAAQPALAAAAAPSKPPAASLGGSDDLFAEVGLQQQALNTRPCPGCTAPMAPDAVICIKCGYNTKLGRRMETIKVGSAGGPEGHGAMAQALLDKAAESIEEQKEEDRKKTAEGVPVYVYAIALAAVIGFCVMMSFIPQGVGMAVAGLVIIVISLCINFYAWMRGLIAAFIQHPGIGLGVFIGDIVIGAGLLALVIFVDFPLIRIGSRWGAAPICWTIYVIANWDTCGIYLQMFWFGGLLRWIGLFMLVMGAWMAIDNQNQDAVAPVAPPPAVAVLEVQSIAVPAIAMSVQAQKGVFDAPESSNRHPVALLPATDRRLAAGRRSDGAIHLAG